MKKLIFGILIAVLALFALWFFFGKGRNEPEGKISAFFHLYSSPADRYLSQVLDEFGGFYPKIAVDYTIMPYQDMKKELLRHGEIANEEAEKTRDRLIVTVLTGGDLQDPRIRPLVVQASPWIRSVWKLYYHKPRLKELGYPDDDLSQLSARGLDVFIEEMSRKTGDGESLFLLGADFFWPWLAWIQQLELLGRNGQMPDDFRITSWNASLDRFSDMEKRGVFNPDFRSINMASSLLGISEGKGLFVLSDDSIYSVYTPEKRHQIGSTDFPGDNDWQTGTGFYLALLAQKEIGSKALSAGRLLLKYMHSEGIHKRFLSNTGIFLLSQTDLEDFGVKKEIPSITQKVRDTELRELLRYLETH